MATEDQDFSCFKGEAISQAWDITGSNITGWAITFTVRVRQTDTAAILTKTATITNATRFTVTLTHAETNIAAKQYYYDCQRVDSGLEVPLALGIFEIKQEVLY